MAISPYVRELRKFIGQNLVLLPAVTVLPFDAQGRVLLVRESDFGTWSTIGGAIEVDESPEKSACREAKEEAGVDVELEGLIGALGGPQFRITYANGDQAAYVSLVYRARVIGGTPTPDFEETSEVGWFSPAELHNLETNPYTQALFVAVGMTPER